MLWLQIIGVLVGSFHGHLYGGPYLRRCGVALLVNEFILDAYLSVKVIGVVYSNLGFLGAPGSAGLISFSTVPASVVLEVLLIVSLYACVIYIKTT